MDVLKLIRWMITHLYNFISGLFFMLLGYFSPIQGVINLVIVVILLDMVFGIYSSRKRGEGIQSRKMWRTVYKLFYSVLIVSLLFSMDKECGILELHKAIAFLITGFEIWSILENISKISNLKLFIVLQKVMNDKIEKKTGINIKEEEENGNMV